MGGRRVQQRGRRRIPGRRHRLLDFGKKRVIPARAIKLVNIVDKIVFLDTKEQVKGAPDHHATWSRADQRDPFIGYYGPMTWS